MALDMVRMMQAQGFSRFSVAGHDRGARVAYRMALDRADRLEHLAVLDVVPTGEALARADARLALDYWPWSLLAQAEPLPEQLILADPEIVVDDALGGWGSDRASFPPKVRTAYIAALRDPDTVHAICEEYRAAGLCTGYEGSLRGSPHPMSGARAVERGERSRQVVRARRRAAGDMARLGPRRNRPRHLRRTLLSRADRCRDHLGAPCLLRLAVARVRPCTLASL